MSDAGKINPDWYDAVENNLKGSDKSVANLIGEYTNTEVDIDDELRVWDYTCNGWLSQDVLDDVCQRIGEN